MAHKPATPSPFRRSVMTGFGMNGMSIQINVNQIYLLAEMRERIKGFKSASHDGAEDAQLVEEATFILNHVAPFIELITEDVVGLFSEDVWKIPEEENNSI